MKTKGVIFDFNGTLFFDNDKHILAWGKISQIIRHKGISEEELHEHFNGVPNNKIIAYLFQKACDEKTLAYYSQLKESYYRQYCQEDTASFHLVAGAEAYFDCLKHANIPFTIASASIKENVDFFVSSFHLDQWLDPHKIVYDDGSYENKIAMFKKAAQRLDIDLQESTIFEDSLSGIESAYQAGCRNIIVVNSADKKEIYQKLPGVTKVIDTFEELIDSHEKV